MYQVEFQLIDSFQRVESVALDGTKRHVLATDRVVQPVALAVQGMHVYWADQVWSTMDKFQNLLES